LPGRTATVRPAVYDHRADAAQATPPLSRSLSALAVIYDDKMCIAGVLGNKQVALGPLAVEACLG
jgi:hypothetical protein